MFSSIISAAIWGVEARKVYVEADVSNGLPCFTIVGYASAQVKEAQERVRTALRNAGIVIPPKRVTINLAPADLRKEGSGFDLPVAAAILLAVGRIPPASMKGVMVMGELGLDGCIRGVSGILPAVLTARKEGCHTCLVPAVNQSEGNLVEGMRVIGISSLAEFLTFACHGILPVHSVGCQQIQEDEAEELDYAQISGQEEVKHAVLLAAAGFHNLLLCGQPGSGKTMIAKRMPSILPPMSREESLEVMKIHSIAGILPSGGILQKRPFRAPHHTASPQALAGGGRVPKPGEVTLAHHGVLFLDELAEMSRRSIEILRQPLEEHEITIARLNGTFRYPASFLFLAAMNPCPCGCYPDMNRCSCTDAEIHRYRSRISQPLLERIDLCAEVPLVSYVALKSERSGLGSAEMRRDVIRVHEIQRKRYQNNKIRFNAHLDAAGIRKFCPMDEEAEMLLGQAFQCMRLSVRAYHQIIKVARTAADLEESHIIRKTHISEAVCYRSLDEKSGGYESER
ncbi:YifB family Mg chelatase-like AAA ATPase [Ruminococcus sp. OA3]|uniref:YifB family Mg chelatase-like AAA ATPase n=1 Tax=Ruminococcus sp. OA3 TaxID=2914164 RepID=UPI001F062E5C|nr:YifB family Mg chelatase-like AAA ATPase [Ruminococcus sp. OA3]MCH1982776.1 YifB family Mg chelatase-like AAA ATPase [Ruminococcus sp. OA3]